MGDSPVKVLNKTFVTSAQQTQENVNTKPLPDQVPIEVGAKFNIKNPLAVEAARQNAARLVVQVTQETQKAIAAVIQRGISEGIAPRDSARMIRSMVGLTQRQAMAVMNARQGWAEAGLAQSIVDKKADFYAAKLLRQRALNIARTETVRAANEGQLAAWKVNVDEGLIPKNAHRQWLAAYSERTCPICSAADGQEVPIDQPFTVAGAATMSPPAHPQCRCTVALTFPKGKMLGFGKPVEEQVRTEDEPTPTPKPKPTPRPKPEPAPPVGKFGEVDFSWKSAQERETITENIERFKRESTAEVERLRKAYPALERLSIKEVVVRPTPWEEANTTLGKVMANGLYSSWQQRVQVSLHRMQADELASVIGSRWTVNPTSAGTFRHETGHAVQDTVFRGLNKTSNYYGSTPAAKEWWALADETLGNPFLERQVRTRISSYAATNQQELFAESFSLYTHPNYKRGALPVDIEKWFDKHLSKRMPMSPDEKRNAARLRRIAKRGDDGL